MNAEAAALIKSANHLLWVPSRGISQNPHTHGQRNTNLLLGVHMEPHDDPPGNDGENQVHHPRVRYVASFSSFTIPV